MIEVEKKFILSEDDIQQITDGAFFLGEQTYTDVYYDTHAYTLSKNDMWLRCRDGLWELKIPMHKKGDSLTQQYEEVRGENSIRQVFDVPQKKDFVADILEFGYAPFCTCTTRRRKFQKGNFVIDLDEVSYDGGGAYRIGEIEIMVEKKEQVGEATEKLEQFARKHNLKIAPVRGKVWHYLKQTKPDHYRALITAGVVKE